MKKDSKILGVSYRAFYAVVIVCVIGIIVGSFCDFQINERLAHVTKPGSVFARVSGALTPKVSPFS